MTNRIIKWKLLLSVLFAVVAIGLSACAGVYETARDSIKDAIGVRPK